MGYKKDSLVKYNLKKGKESQKTHQIYLVLVHQGKRLRYYIGKRIDPKYWDKKKQRAKAQYPDAINLNNFLNSRANYLEDKYVGMQILGEKITIKKLRDLLDEIQNKKDSLEFFEKFDEFLEVSKNIRAESTIKKFRTTKTQLEDFCDKYKIDIEFDDINKDFEEKYKSFLINDLKHSNNTVTKYIKTLKTFLNWAVEKEYCKNTEFRKFATRESETDIIYLKWDELMTLYKFEFDTKLTRLKKIRDVFCFGCFTGLRFSDIMNLKHENIKDEFIELTTVKTGAKAVIPFTKYSKEIYEQYRGEKGFVFERISNQKMNEYLKELTELAEINEPVEVTHYKGAKRITKYVPKHKVITSHIARKTFITNALAKGMKAEVIMDITTQKDYKVFKRYFKIVNEHKKNEMLNAFN